MVEISKNQSNDNSLTREIEQDINATKEENTGFKLNLDDLSVHTMPTLKTVSQGKTVEKSFVPATGSTGVAGDSTKKVGIFIFGGGAVLMIAVFAFIYFFFIASPKSEMAKQITPIVPKVEESDSLKQPETLATNTDSEVEELEAGQPDVLMPEIASNTEADMATASELVVVSPEGDSGAIEYVNATDTDLDGLSDVEEAVFRTNADSGDSDDDGFGDLAEINNLYNPAGSGQLLSNENMNAYHNSAYSYSLYYPKDWVVDNLGDDATVIFKAPDNQFIQILVQPNPSEMSAAEWYEENYGEDELASARVVTRDGWEGIEDKDGVVAVLTAVDQPGYIFNIIYNTGIERVLNYQNIFELAVNSMELSE